MAYFGVTRKPGDAWDASRGMREQAGWDEHAAFMDALAEDGFVVLGGPLGDGSKFLLIIDAENEDEIGTRLEADPGRRLACCASRGSSAGRSCSRRPSR